MPTKTSAIVLAVAIVGFCASAASAGQYVLKHPKHEHCRPHYVEKVNRRRETMCVQVRTPTFVLVTAEAWEGHGHLKVNGDVQVVGGHGLLGVPITYTITNEATGEHLGSFTEPSDPLQPCALGLTVSGDTQTFSGESAPPEEACPIDVSLPTGQLAVITGSFAGTSTYAPSVSEGKGL